VAQISLGVAKNPEHAMLEFRHERGVQLCDGMTRRDFLRVGAIGTGAFALSAAELTRLPAAEAAKQRDGNCILLFLVGGPSQLDTWDLKPYASADVRGPFQPIKTNVPGLEICEHFPRMARIADRYAIIRSVHHKSAPIHETGQQMMQTGRLFEAGREYPHCGSVMSYLRGEREPGIPPFVVVPSQIGSTGVSVSHGQTSGFLGAKHEPFVLDRAMDPARLLTRTGLIDAVDDAERVFDSESGPRALRTDDSIETTFAAKRQCAFDIAAEPQEVRDSYGMNTFGQSCLLARRLVERGVRLVTVNMFDTVFNQITWDCHADGGSLRTRLSDYKDTLCPMFDLAYAALLNDLHERGLLSTTLVIAMGEFGRTPKINPRGGRDHWPGVWSVLFAGAGVRGGQVIGASDRTASEPCERPVNPSDIAATIYQALGVDPRTCLPGTGDDPPILAPAHAVNELFC
jgi:uncharacterized protein (DUF1501 family)